MHEYALVKLNNNFILCVAKNELRALIEAQAASFALELQQVRMTIDDQNQTIVSLQQTVDEKCETIERQQMTLEQVNTTLQMFIETQEMSNSEQDGIATNLTALSNRFPRECIPRTVYIAMC